MHTLVGKLPDILSPLSGVDLPRPSQDTGDTRF